jgi:uncharacterized protein YcbK (DUF882 family)
MLEINDWDEWFPNFSPNELKCKGTGELKVDLTALCRLQGLRNHWGKPLIINSGYRSKEYNTKIGGAVDSYHMLGRAFDVRETSQEFIELAKYYSFHGIGVYSTFTHIDTGPPRTWRG